MRCTWILALGVVLAGPAVAQSPTPASAAGAQALSRDLAAYLGQTAFDRKIVTVTPEGNAYRITLAPNAMIEALVQTGVKVRVTPWSVLVSERADGDWDVSSADPIGVTFDVTVEGQRQQGDYQIEAGRFTGVFSPRLGAFLSGAGDYPGGTMTTSDPASDIAAHFGKTTYDTAGKDAGGGAVDATARQRVSDLSEKVTVKGDAGAPDGGMPFDLTAKTIAIDAALEGFRSRAILDLWAFGVTHADHAKAVADQETLRRLLTAALPVWKTMRGSYDFAGFDVTSDFGSVKIDKMSFGFQGDGVSTSSAFSYRMGFDGLSYRSPMVPAWAAGLTPEALSLTMKVEGLDLDTPAKRLIADFDLSTPDIVPPETSATLGAAFTDNPPRLVLEPSRLKTRDAEVTVQGDVLVSEETFDMNVTVEAAGIDTVIATLQGEAANDPSLNEVVGSLQLVKGFAKALPDGRSQWVVAAKSDGSVIVNGSQIVAPSPEMPETGPAPTDDNAMPTEPPTP